jgi:hypothetical protein
MLLASTGDTALFLSEGDALDISLLLLMVFKFLYF